MALSPAVSELCGVRCSSDAIEFGVLGRIA
jgi:hypothetical protein